MKDLQLIFLLFLIVYIFGAIPTGYWLGLLQGKDLTKEGSKSTGATNALRVLGKWQGALVLLVDILKGFLPIFYIKNFLDINSWFVLILCITAIVAHSKSVFIGFKGGKSSAIGLGVLVAMNPIVGILTVSIWFAAVKISGYSSMGSIVCIPLVPFWLYIFGEDGPTILFGVIAFVYIILIKHRTNIQRLLNGTEPKVGENKEENKS